MHCDKVIFVLGLDPQFTTRAGVAGSRFSRCAFLARASRGKEGQTLSARKIVIATFGSLGDLHPFVALAHALTREGFSPVIATSAAYAEYITGEGLGFVAIRPDADDLTTRLGMDMGEIARQMAEDDKFLFGSVIFPHLRESYEDLLAACADADAVVAHSLAFAGRLAAERLGLPLVTVLLSPLMLYSPHDPPLGSSAPFLPAPAGRMAVAYNFLLLWSLSHALALWAAPLRRLRRETGLSRRHGLDLLLGVNSSDAVIGLFSPLLALPQLDGAGAAIMGHTFHDRFLGADHLPPALEAFLDAGEAPIVFSLGSFVARARNDFYRDCVAVARDLGRRAVLLAHEDDVGELTRDLPESVFVASYAPHSRVFPRAHAIVHHGGVGTSGQALRAGRPQVVTPFLGDQFDNAHRLQRLGVARIVDGKTATPAALAAALRSLDADHAARARTLAEVVRREDGAASAAARISAMLAPGRAAPVYERALA